MPLKSVVIIEDDPDTAELLAEMMQWVGYRVFRSDTGRKAIDLIAQRRPELILLDQMLPDISGLEVLHSLQMDPRLRRIPAIIISARNLPSDLRRGLDAGAVSYLVKPVAFAELKTAVEQALPPAEIQGTGSFAGG